MRILGIESSSLVASAAVVEDDVTLAEYTVNYAVGCPAVRPAGGAPSTPAGSSTSGVRCASKNRKTHSQTLLPMIDAVMNMIDMELSALDAIAVSGGPGSFTGLRIGSATAKGLGLALGKPLIHVPTLDATAYNLYGTSALICPIMDARRNQVYTGLYRFEREFSAILEQDVMDMGALIEKLNGMGERVIFLGDGAPVYRERIIGEMTAPFDFAPAHMNRQRASSVAALGAVYFAGGKIETAAEHRPDYLRKSQAEREREEREAASGKTPERR